jgi:ribosomal protein S11
MAGFKGSRKSTPYAAQLAAANAEKKGIEHGLKEFTFMLKGREVDVRRLFAPQQSSGLMLQASGT